MKWTIRTVRVTCACGHTKRLGVDVAIGQDTQAMVRQALSVSGWLRVADRWHCPTCAARLVTCQRGLTIQTQAALIERAEATRITVTGVR